MDQVVLKFWNYRNITDWHVPSGPHSIVGWWRHFTFFFAQYDTLFFLYVPLRSLLQCMDGTTQPHPRNTVEQKGDADNDWLKCVHFQAQSTMNYVAKIKLRYDIIHCPRKLSLVENSEWRCGMGRHVRHKLITIGTLSSSNDEDNVVTTNTVCTTTTPPNNQL